jgi:hypothetical protein
MRRRKNRAVRPSRRAQWRRGIRWIIGGVSGFLA